MMNKIVDRESITDIYYREILDKETHHDHEIIEDEHGTYRWKENSDTEYARQFLNLNSLIPLFLSLGIDKNHETYRLLYRNMGYSLSGYWEIFYWETNNEEAHKYNPPLPSDAVVIPINPSEIVHLSLQLEEMSARLNEIGCNARPETKFPDANLDKWAKGYHEKHFSEKWEELSNEEAKIISQRIDEDNIQAFSTGSSLHISEAKFEVDNEIYKFIEAIGYDGVTVERLIKKDE